MNNQFMRRHQSDDQEGYLARIWKKVKMGVEDWKMNWVRENQSARGYIVYGKEGRMVEECCVEDCPDLLRAARSKGFERKQGGRELARRNGRRICFEDAEEGGGDRKGKKRTSKVGRLRKGERVDIGRVEPLDRLRLGSEYGKREEEFRDCEMGKIVIGQLINIQQQDSSLIDESFFNSSVVYKESRQGANSTRIEESGNKNDAEEHELQKAILAENIEEEKQDGASESGKLGKSGDMLVAEYRSESRRSSGVEGDPEAEAGEHSLVALNESAAHESPVMSTAVPQSIEVPEPVLNPFLKQSPNIDKAKLSEMFNVKLLNSHFPFLQSLSTEPCLFRTSNEMVFEQPAQEILQEQHVQGVQQNVQGVQQNVQQNVQNNLQNNVQNNLPTLQFQFNVQWPSGGLANRNSLFEEGSASKVEQSVAGLFGVSSNQRSSQSQKVSEWLQGKKRQRPRIS